MRLFRPGDGPTWLGAVLKSIENAFRTIMPGPLRLKGYATADLPPAGDTATGSNVQGAVYDLTQARISYSNGVNWITIYGAGTNAADARANLGLAAGGAGDIWVQLAGDTMTGELVHDIVANDVGTTLKGATTGISPTHKIADSGGTVRARIGIAGEANAFVAGSAANDLVLRTEGAAILFTADGGTTLSGKLTAAGFRIFAEARCATLRIDATPTAETPTPTHTVPINIGGTVYRFPCVI